MVPKNSSATIEWIGGVALSINKVVLEIKSAN